ncbi:MAG: nucleotidyl transferase AbiEii/AbiGii toxin family protein [Pirellulales bacterium]|nr:nucleotidyl transferase AbiEii/AbiGii toxin family protein [Pirellulales bacterium]
MMNNDALGAPSFHEDIQRFRTALLWTERHTGFSAVLIEKDYYASLLLHDWGPIFAAGVVFKGGTSLSKIHAEFLRLSEDLDFALPQGTQSSQAARRQAMAPIKAHLETLTRRFPCLHVAEPLQAHNRSRQYCARLRYRSALTDEDEYLSLEIALREPILCGAEDGLARTLLCDPTTAAPILQAIAVRVLSRLEAYAEKVRAALTRQPDPAIRDFFDLAVAVERRLFDPFAPEFLRLVQRKLAGHDPPDLSAGRLDRLRSQLESRLRAVLREADYQAFSLMKAIELVREILARLRALPPE